MSNKCPTNEAAAVEVSGITCWSSRGPATAMRLSSLVNGRWCAGKPSTQPSILPTSQPSVVPSSQPTGSPTMQPSVQPSVQPFDQPSAVPTTQPTGVPTMQPSTRPSSQPSAVPLMQPSVSPVFQYVGLMRGPIHSMKDLAKVLSTRKELRVVEEMKKVLTNDVVFLLVDHFP